MHHLRPGVVECDLEKHLDSRGLPLSCHRMINFGEKARRGLASPSAQRAKRGQPYTIGFGVQGALSCRAGMIAAGPNDLTGPLREFYPSLAANYFQVVAAWYKHVRVGANAGAVARAVEAVRDPKLYRFAVNPGHYLHLDEWVHSPFAIESRVQLRSGMALQMDIIPVSLGPFCYINAEDGIVLADARLRAQLARGHPDFWKRAQARRAFMRERPGDKPRRFRPPPQQHRRLAPALGIGPGHSLRRPSTTPPPAVISLVSENYQCLSRRPESGRGQPQSKTLREFWRVGARVSVLDCGCPLPLWLASVWAILRKHISAVHQKALHRRSAVRALQE